MEIEFGSFDMIPNKFNRASGFVPSGIVVENKPGATNVQVLGLEVVQSGRMLPIQRINSVSFTSDGNN
jgi:hypothetical protein